MGGSSASPKSGPDSQPQNTQPNQRNPPSNNQNTGVNSNGPNVPPNPGGMNGNQGNVPGSVNTGAGAGTGGVGCVDISSLVECKQEPDNEFVDLEQCAAALEKDVAANGACFPGFSDFIGGGDNGDEISTDALKDLISDISDFHPDFIKDFDFEDKSNIITDPLKNGHIKIEDDKDSLNISEHQSMQTNLHQQQHNGPMNTTNPGNMMPSQQYSPAARLPYTGLDFKSEHNPAAQTLKQMAEQHKAQQMGMAGYNPSAAAAAAAAAAASRAPVNTRSPYGDFSQFAGGPNDYLGSPNNVSASGISLTQSQSVAYHKSNGATGMGVGFQSQQTADMFASQTPFAASGLSDMNKRPPQSQVGKPPNILQTHVPAGGYKQQYSPYGSPGSLPNHGSPGYPLPPRGAQGQQGPGQGAGPQGPFNNSTPPRPSSGSGTSTLQINQAQQLHINNPGHQIQVSIFL